MTRLTLSMLSWPVGVYREDRDFGEEVVIGRSLDCGWTLQDPLAELSRRHCVLSPAGNGWQVADLSANGTYVNEDQIALGERHHDLADGDRLRLGPYVLAVRYEAHDDPELPGLLPDTDDTRFATPGDARFGAADGKGLGVFPPDHGWHDSGWQDPVPSPAGARAAAGPVAPGPGLFVGPATPDRAPAVSAAFVPPQFQVSLPDDFEQAMMAGYPSAPGPATPGPATPSPATPGPAPTGPADDPTIMADSKVALRQEVRARDLQSGADGDLFAQFLRGTGLPGLDGASPAAVLEAVGRLLRIMVGRMRELQSTRSAVKREFRIAPTVMHLQGNNPIKFAADDEAALRTLLAGRIAPARAVAEVLDNVRLHELALVGAMQDAVRRMLDELSPPAAQGPGVAGLLSVQRKANAYDRYCETHARIVAAFSDDFDSVFGKAFARAYEKVVHDAANADAGDRHDGDSDPNRPNDTDRDRLP